MNWAGAGHAALSVLGFIPVLGAFTDLANSIWYLFEGEIAKSLTSLVSALPGLGDLIGAGAKKVQLAKTAAAVKAMGLIGKSAVSGLSIGNTISTNIDRYLNGEKFTLGQVGLDLTSIFLNAFAIKLSVNEAKKIEEALKALKNIENVDKFIKSNVPPSFQKSVKDAFGSDAKVTTLKQDTTVYRYYGGDSKASSYWVTPYKVDNPISELALPPGNTAQYMDTIVLPKGTTVIEGTVAPQLQWGQPGGGYQYYVVQ